MHAYSIRIGIHFLECKNYMTAFYLSIVFLVHLSFHIYIITVTSSHILKNLKKKQHLIKCQFLPDDQIISVIGNEMDKSDQLACIRYKNQNVLA